jgi:hypothetical protein
MLASAIIVFREVLEAALILSIVAAATRTIAGRNKWLLIGVLSGLTGAVIVAALATRIAEAMEGLGQEVFNATVLLLAVAMLGWHNIWMQSHGRQLASTMTSMGSAVAAGSKSMIAVAIAVGLAVLREGSEVVLFLYGIAGSGSSAAGNVRRKPGRSRHRRRGRLGALRRTSEAVDEEAVRGHELDDPAAGSRHGRVRCEISGPGRPVAGLRQRDLGHLFVAA